MANDINIDRDYIDDTAVKEFVTDEDDGLIDKYFEDIDVSLRNVGTIGYTTELVSTVSQDTFNSSSVLFRETFVNRAQIPESIYSHAALFQIDETFSSAAQCKFLLVMEEQSILKNMIDSRNTDIYHFYIGKDTTIYVEDLAFTLDYDIRMDIVKKVTENGEDYIFTARYISTYQNSISDVTSPFITVRRSSDGFIALEVDTHQCYRVTQLETILTNTEINYQVIDVNFDGKLAGFDILYKPANSKMDFSSTIDEVYDASGGSWYTLDDNLDNPNEEALYDDNLSIKQMKKLLVYSEPLTEPFCYYQMLDDDTIRITFNTKDRFFMPEFNSEIKIILYITEGSDGNFDVYNGTNISLVPDNELISYANTYLTAAKPIGSSADGTDQMDIDGIQSMAAEGYRTALALTTDNDLQEYFNNYKYRFGDADILFIKKRDDVYERVFSAFNIMRNKDYIYKTNTLNLDMNIFEMRNPEKNVFMLDPGHLFTIESNDGFAQILRDNDKEAKYKELYDKAVSSGTAGFLYENNYGDYPDTVIPSYLKRNASFAEWKSRQGYDDKLTIFDICEKIDEKENPTDTNVKYRFSKNYKALDDSPNKKFLVMNPFLIRFTKNPNLVSSYLTYVTNTSAVDFVAEDASSYVQFVDAILHVDRAFEKEKKYRIYTTIQPSITLENSNRVVKTTLVHNEEGDEYVFTPITEHTKYELDNDLRVVAVISDGKKNVCYTELYPTKYDMDTQQTTFECEMFTDDHITSDGLLRIIPQTIYRDGKGSYYKVFEDDATLYHKYNEADDSLVLDSKGNPEVYEFSNDYEPEKTTIRKMLNNNQIFLYENTKNMATSTYINIPLTDVNVKIYTLYRKHYSISAEGLVLNDKDPNSNIFVKYDNTLAGYKVTNEYHTATNPITFIEPLDNVRSSLIYKDYTEHYTAKDHTEKFKNDIFDSIIYSINFIRASEFFNTTMFTYFLDSFLATYKHLNLIMSERLRNVTAIDTKFYNTYGRSKNFFIGDEEELLDTVNLRIEFDMWFLTGTDMQLAIPEVKAYIKSEIETVNEKGMNNLFISNLMRKIENKFAYVDHIRFKSINGYNSKYQAVKYKVTDINDLEVEERRFYVPEFLLCDTDDIIITEYYAS